MQDRIKVLSDFEAAPASAIFDQKIIAIVRDCSTYTLERDRWAGGGIPYLKIRRAVRYRKSDVVAWLDQHELCYSTTN